MGSLEAIVPGFRTELPMIRSANDIPKIHSSLEESAKA